MNPQIPKEEPTVSEAQIPDSGFEMEITDRDLINVSDPSWKDTQMWVNQLSMSMESRNLEYSEDEILVAARYLATFSQTLEELRGRFNYPNVIPINIVYRYQEKNNRAFMILADSKSRTVHISIIALMKFFRGLSSIEEDFFYYKLGDTIAFNGTLMNFARLNAVEEFDHVTNSAGRSNSLWLVNEDNPIVEYDAQDVEHSGLLLQLQLAVEWKMPWTTINPLGDRLHNAIELRRSRRSSTVKK